MRKLLPAWLMLVSVQVFGQTATPTLKSVLLAQLRSTHNKAEWFVPANTAVAGLTAEQANWKDNSGNHSVGQLVQHLVFWNERQLSKFQGKEVKDFKGDNNETFANVDKTSWETAVKKLDEILTGLEQFVEKADEKTLSAAAGNIANISAHNAYHTGQIIFVRKEQGSWNPENGVK
ncbi:DinB superfamily protein [Chitinophaga eiseniae]|uniref:DinB superfamily protein n=1 Tax=Chitinophaga eiseniae TaxID=634771 RepID=A0A1T4T0T5_9BACT|nr:DinB family protein [Chitinophaga eiseniae]SKA34084.1 DinB superfamily protein [Chitinophaga eiseniae]